VSATEDGPLVDGEVVASPRIGSSFVEEGECRVDFARGLDVVDVLDKVATERLVALLASVVPIRRVDFVANMRIELRGRLLCGWLLCRGGWCAGRGVVRKPGGGIVSDQVGCSWHASYDSVDVVHGVLTSRVESRVEHHLEHVGGEVDGHSYWFVLGFLSCFLILRVFLLRFFLLFRVFDSFFGLLFLLVFLRVRVFDPLLGLLRFWF